ncbi:copper chaperone PCu(A)C [Streptomyces luteolus]|uniref:DUF461 domain-containing protein n=1 Tax=Streptomyces luteolus TaxID=3043615 RepID=A0ABT6SQM1_9ACTN|nr:DUF461 domain-containing protein [Streptomyces sp. B-S-A12]MDI3417907.1 DUF461 domain-containing protein [Streptomyces sp. B-S-A12]
MSRSLRRGTIAATALGFAIATLAACGAGNNAQTLEIKPDNAAIKVGDIKIQNAIVITQPDPKSTGPAAISATVFNNGDTAQTLESIKVEGADKAAELKPAKGSGPLTIPAGGSLIIGGAGNASASLPSSPEAVQDGNAQPVTFSFSETGDVKMKTFVVPATSYFKKWGPSEVPAAPEATPSKTATPTGGATGKPTEGATEGATGGATEGAGDGANGDPANGTPSNGASDAAAHEGAGH